MTHLKIEQNNGIIEEVSSAVIDKLYDIVHSGNLDNTSNLIGRLHAPATYQDYIDYLEDAFKINGVKQLIIDATKKYIRFADPTVASYWANSTHGDGTGIISSDANSVLSIPNSAFKNNTSIQTFNELGRYFPNCTTIYYDCFWGCSNLKSIDLSNITSIQGNGFNGCSNLGYTNNGVLNIPKITSFGVNAFADCTSLVEVNIGSEINDSNRITSLSSGVFANCSNLEKITGLNKVSNITGRATFIECSKLESLDFTSALINLIGDEIFRNCVSLECINLINVTNIGNGCFYGCTKLVDLSTNDQTQINTGAVTYTFNWNTVPKNLFQSCKLTNKSFSFPNATSIGENAFRSSGIVGIDSPNVTSIGNSAFENCNKLTTLDLSNVTSIGDHAFKGCTSLTQFPCDPSVVTQIWDSAFENCTNMGQDTTLELNLTQQVKCPQYGFYGTKFKGLILHWPSLSNLTFDGRYNIWENMLQLEYLDMSDTIAPIFDSTNQYRGFGFYQNPNITTAIFPETQNYLSNSMFTLRASVNDNTKYKYLILLSTTPPHVESGDNYNPPSGFFRNRPALNIYVPDSALSSYLSDSGWLQLGDGTNNFNLSDRVKGLSELPDGVWTTGLASQYLTPAQLATS